MSLSALAESRRPIIRREPELECNFCGAPPECIVRLARNATLMELPEWNTLRTHRCEMCGAPAVYANSNLREYAPINFETVGKQHMRCDKHPRNVIVTYRNGTREELEWN